MKNGTCFIVGAGIFQGMSVMPETDDYIIAADGGYTHLRNLGIEPDVLIGDFDSLEVIPEHRNLIQHSPIKDDTDMALAAAYAAREGYRRFLIYGGLGGRLDHTMANLMLLNSMAKAGLEVYLAGEGSIITAVSEERVVFPKEFTGMISVFCLGEPCTGVTEYGLKYGLDDEELKSGMTLGVSNEFLGKESYIEVKRNVLTVMWEEKNGLPLRRTRINQDKKEDACGEGDEAGSSDETAASSLVSRMGWNSMQNENETFESDRYSENRRKL